MQIPGHHAPADRIAAPDRAKPPGEERPAGVRGFADLMSTVSEAADAAASPASPAAAREAEDIARMQRDLAAYKRERDKIVQGRTIDPPATQMALPVNDLGYMPYVTADQQKLMDRITDSYLGRPQWEMEKMWRELEANGVTPDQLVRSAKYFINLDGEIVSRAVAMGGQRSAPSAGTAWTASSV
ncbi:hypothetical protein [Azospirillum sp. ST 5-10]|uniref:hypothetical protein n=1 Tax=unclassified Azospirillum TaxID=2630922 RepID=UPI003F4A2786